MNKSEKHLIKKNKRLDTKKNLLKKTVKVYSRKWPNPPVKDALSMLFSRPHPPR